MKQIPIILLFVLAALPQFADEVEGRRTWLVATYGPAEVLLDMRGGLTEAGRGVQADFLRERSTARFRHVNGFAAELTPTEAKNLERSPFVRWVEPNHARVLLSTTPAPVTTPSDASQVTPFGISMIRAPQVWPATRGAAVRIGIADTGIDRAHPELTIRYRGGWDFVNGDDDPQDDNGHGTHVAGTIAALDNDLGVVGVAPEADLYALKVLNASGSGSVVSLIKAVEWAIDNDLDIFNMSLGSAESSLLEKEAFTKAEEAGIICIAASGNAYAGVDGLDYPARYASVISVGAIDSARSIARFSQRGSDLDFVAPGVGIDSTFFSTYFGISTSDGKVFRADPMAYSPGGSVSGMFVDCGIGAVGDFPPSVKGQIALIKRGELTFADKSKNAKEAGAKAVVIYNHNSDLHPEGGVVNGSLASPGSWILTVGTARSTGEYLLSLSDRNVRLNEITASEYRRASGTSMAAPHLAGAVGLLLALDPDATRFQIVDALQRTAQDLGAPGRDNTFGYGLIDVSAAARLLSPHAFSSPEPRRRATRRPGSD